MPYTAPESSASSTSPLCSPTPPGSSKNPHVRSHHKAHVNFLASHLPRRTGSDQGHVQCYCDKLIVINRFVIDLNPFQRWHHIQKGKIIPAYLLSLAVTKVWQFLCHSVGLLTSRKVCVIRCFSLFFCCDLPTSNNSDPRHAHLWWRPSPRSSTVRRKLFVHPLDITRSSLMKSQMKFLVTENACKLTGHNWWWISFDWSL